MKLFVAVVMFLIVPSVLAEDFQGIALSSQVESKPPKSQTQGDHGHPGYVALTARETTGDADADKTTAGDGQGKPNPSVDGGDQKPPWAAIVTVVVSFVSLCVSLYSLFLTDQAKRITERAYLAAEQWEIAEGGYIFCNLSNKGRTPATLLHGYTKFTLWDDVAATTSNTWRNVDRDFENAELPAQVTIPMQVGPLTHGEWSAVKNERSLTLFVEAHIRYRDAFKETRIMRFKMEYDGRIQKFIIADKRTATKERN